MAIYLIGLGIDYRLSLPKDVIHDLNNCEKIYWENYTSPAPYDIYDIEEIIQRRVEILDRNFLENYIERIIEEAKNKDIAILVNGDPLIATTHSYIIKYAHDIGVAYKVFHNSSILSAAIGESGLHVYKFGPSGTIMREDRAPNTRNSDILENNLKLGLHTLFYLEYSSEDNYVMTPYDAFKQLVMYPVSNLLDKIDPYVIVLCGLGFKKHIKTAFKYHTWEKETKRICRELEKLRLPCIIIICGRLHFTEEEYIKDVLEKR